MKMELPEIPATERTPLVESLLAIIRHQQDRIGKLEETVRQLKDEIAVLKGQKARPQIRPSSLESNLPKLAVPEGGKRPGSEKRPKNVELHIHKEIQLDLEVPPQGSRFRGYESYVVQELLIQTENTRYHRARYELPDGGSVLTPFPKGIRPVAGGHFGANLIVYILNQYHHCQVTQPLLLEQLRELGIDISSGQLSRILTENLEAFHQEKTEVLTTGLRVSSYIGTDDTGARHQGKNGFCTAIGNDLFSYFESTGSKSRVNFLQILQGGQRAYVINELTLAYWKQQRLPEMVVVRLARKPRRFLDEAAWQARLEKLGIDDRRHVRIATEGVLLGGLIASGVSPDLAVLSDGAHQFALLVHASCWIHAERPLVRMVPHNDQHRVEIERLRGHIWELYKDLKAYRCQPDPVQRPLLEARFDALVEQRNGYPNLASVLREMRAHKADLLRVLERPEIPLHNNALESDIREYVKRRKISGSTRSDEGRRCRDTFASLKKTCRKLGVRFWAYLQDRIRGLGQMPPLTDLIRLKAAQTNALKQAATA
jgi:hypothetical protein